MKSDAFWQYFSGIRPQLAARANTFGRIFEYLDRFDRPVRIVETGCTRDAGNWGGDGGSTVLFDKYAECHPGSVVYSVDIDPAATALCRTLVSTRVQVHTGDSVDFLKSLADMPPTDFIAIDLLYLDSYDVDFENPHPSAMHHMKELVAVAPLLQPETLVVVDDSPSSFTAVVGEGGQIGLVAPVRVGGKGKYVAEYAQNIRAEKLFESYQCGWIGMRGRAGAVVPGSSFLSGIITASDNGIFAVGAEDQFVGRQLRETGAFGLAEIERAAQYITKDDEVLVVGAHVGTVAIGLARRCREATLIEANPRTFKLLQCNLILNDVRNAVAFNYAASDSDGVLPFVMNRVNSGGSKRMPLVRESMYFYDNPETVEVPARRMDGQLPGRDFALVFMDIEGSEYFALKGMQDILAKARALIVEFIPHHLKNVAGVSPEQFVATIAPHFTSLWVPSTQKRVDRADFAPLLRNMFEADRADEGIVFTK
jgi:FkbM family methyltransferase